jgi:hypothetical protein
MSSGSRPPPAPDPQVMIDAQTRANRVGRTGPFGSATYESGPNGSTNVNTTLSPEMQALVSRQFQRAGQDSQQYQRPQGFEALQSAMMNQVAGGVGANRLGNFQQAQTRGAIPDTVQQHYKPQGTQGLPHPSPMANDSTQIMRQLTGGG